MRWTLFNFNHNDDNESDIIGLTYKGYTAPDSAQSTEPNSLASIDQPDTSLRTSSKHTNKLHHSTTNSIVNNNNNHNTSSCNSNSIAGTTSKSIANNSNNNNNHVRYSNAIPAINTMSSKASSKSASSNSHQYSSIANQSATSSAAMASITSSTASYETTVRKSPEGKDNDSYHIEDTKGRMSANNNLAKHNNNGQLAPGSNGTNAGHQKIGNDISTEIFSASNDNGKINVQVTVLVDTHNLDQSHAGTTLANLKKQRAQSRNSGTSENGSLMGGAPQSINSSIIGTGNGGGGGAGTSSGVQSMELSLLSSTNDLSESTAPTITKFSGVTSDVVSDSTRSRRCCVVM